MLTPNKRHEIHILIVDDDIAFATSAKNCLKLNSDYCIDMAFSVTEALEKMKTKRPDAIICDIQMPISDGFEFLRSLRKSGNDIPFIVFTVAQDKETAIKAFSLGANGFVGKYGDPEIVFSTLQRCIEKTVQES
jgi:DNA-binding NarL/FixJ family response regulator